MINLIEATSLNDYKLAVELFKEYASYIKIDLAFQNFSKEIGNLEAQYSKPKGNIFLAYKDQSNPVGCFGIREFKGETCELKRMYLKNEARGLGIGKLMLKKAIETGKELGYNKMRLDTLSTMQSAIRMYKQAGFYEIPAYRFNPLEGAKYFEIELKG